MARRKCPTLWISLFNINQHLVVQIVMRFLHVIFVPRLSVLAALGVDWLVNQALSVKVLSDLVPVRTNTKSLRFFSLPSSLIDLSVLSSISSSGFHSRGGEPATLSPGPFLSAVGPSSYQCRWKLGGTTQLTLATAVGATPIGNYAETLRCDTATWASQTGVATLEVLYQGSLLTNSSLSVNIFSSYSLLAHTTPKFLSLLFAACNYTGTSCTTACLSQQFCGWCLESNQCSDSGAGCPGLWVTGQCLSAPFIPFWPFILWFSVKPPLSMPFKCHCHFAHTFYFPCCRCLQLFWSCC